MSQSVHRRKISRNSIRAHSRGVTLIELLVAMAMLAILLGIAVPSFTSVINSNRLSGHVNELAAAFQGARVEAIRRNARVVVCGSSNGATCATNNTVWERWISFVDEDLNNAPDGGILLRTGAIVPPVEMRTSENIEGQIVIRPDGMARTGTRTLLNGQMRVCIPTTFPRQNWRDLQIDAGSRVTTHKGDGAGVCDQPADVPPPIT